MHVTRARTTRWVACAALLAGLGLTGGAGSGAQADTSGSGGFVIYTQIALSGDVYSDGSSPNAPAGWTPPKCWLQLNSGFGVDPASTPDEFAVYMGQIYAFLHHAQEDPLQQAIYNLYYKGMGVDPGVGLTNPPYNQGLGNGAWYGMACSPDSGYGDYLALAASMGAANPDENWFWLNNGTPPPGVPVMDPNLLAEYAAANTHVTPGWPNFSPGLNAMQTVNLATLITNGAGQNGYRRYSATASIPGESSTVFATPSSVTFTSTGPTSPSSVTCYFSAGGRLQGGCQLTFLKSTRPGTSYTITESSMWNVTWGGDPVTGEPGWTRQIGPVTQTSGPILVQEIQSVVGH